MSTVIDAQTTEHQGFSNPDPVTAKLLHYHEQHATDAAPIKQAFILALRETGVVRRACEAVEIDSKTAYIWRSIDPEFRRAWDYALEDATDLVEHSLFRQATSDKCFLATIAWLKARRPMYRDRLEVDVNAVRREIEERLDRMVDGTATAAGVATSSPPPAAKTILAEALVEQGLLSASVVGTTDTTMDSYNNQPRVKSTT